MTALHAALNPELLAFAMSKGVSREDAEDLMQQVWAAFAKTSDATVIGAPRAWLYRTLRNRLTDRYRRRATQPLIVPLENRFGESRLGENGFGDSRQGRMTDDETVGLMPSTMGHVPPLQTHQDTLPSPNNFAASPSALDADDFWSHVDGALAELPAFQAETFRRNVIDGEALLDIARSHGVPVRTAISRKRYARERLRPLLGDLYERYFETD